MEKIFKGKIIDNAGSDKCYVFSLFEIQWSDHDSIRVKVNVKINSKSNLDSFIFIHKTTISQYTGINDSEGNRIFEGDRVYIAGVGEVIAAITPNGVTFGGWDYQDVIEDIEKLTGYNIHDRGE